MLLEHPVVVFMFSMCFKKIIAIIISECHFPCPSPEST